MPRKLPPKNILCALLSYCIDTGELVWKPRDDSMFKQGGRVEPSAIRAGWNTRHAGKPALTADNGLGYRYGTVFGEAFLAHRVAWKMMTGEDPDDIDHINGDPSDNRFCNLRSVTRSINMRNAALPKHNKSGRIGVRWDGEKWVAAIKMDRKNHVLGRFETFEEARAAREAAERDNNFHENHGRTNTNDRN